MKVTQCKSPSFKKNAIVLAIAVIYQTANGVENNDMITVKSRSPFYPTPFNIIDETSTSGKGVETPPRVMMLVSDNTTMGVHIREDLQKPVLCENSWMDTIYPKLNMDSYTRGVVDEHIESPDCRLLFASEPNSSGIPGQERIKFVDENIDSYRLSNKKRRFKLDPNAPNKSDSAASRLLTVDGKLVESTDGSSYGVAYEVFRHKGIYYRFPSPGTRMEVTKEVMNELLDEYNNQIAWNILTFWGSEETGKDECPAEWLNTAVNPDYYDSKLFTKVVNSRTDIPKEFIFRKNTPDKMPYLSAEEMRTKVNGMHFMSRRRNLYQNVCSIGAAPSTMRYLQAAKIVADSMKENQCNNDYIIMFSDGNPFTLRNANNDYFDFKNAKWVGYPANTEEYSPYYINNVNGYNSVPSGYSYNGTSPNEGIAYFSQKLLNANLRESGYPQNIQTYTIGFGNTLTQEGQEYLKQAAAVEPKVNSNGTKEKREGYFSATDADSLRAAFKSIFDDILPETNVSPVDTGSTASPGNVSTEKADGMAATLTLNTGNWTSSLSFFKLDEEGNPKIDKDKTVDYAHRRFLMNNGNKVYWLDKDKLDSTDGSADTIVAQADFGFDSGKEMNQFFLPWLRRDAGLSDEKIIEKFEKYVKDENIESPKVKMYRDRLDPKLKIIDGKTVELSRNMGDVLNAPVLGINADTHRYVVTGANDGMVYIFRDTDDAKKPYSLALNYLPGSIPRENSDDTLAQNLYRLARNDYGQSTVNPHIYGVNGDIAYVKTAKTAGRQQKIIALGAMGQGGRGVYALNIAGCEPSKEACEPAGLDVNNSDNWQSKVPLWESKAESTGQINLGYTYSKPVMYQVAKKWNTDGPVTTDDVRLAGFVANGFRAATDSLPHDEQPTLYVYDALGEEVGSNKGAATDIAGELIGKISVPAETGESPTLLNVAGKGALASPAIVDTNRDGIADIAYAGDYAGNLYRFDLRSEPGSWSAKRIYAGESTQPITSAPSVYHNGGSNYIVVFGTGSDLFEKDLTDVTNRQGFFGIFDDIDEESPKAIKRSDLAKKTFSESGNARTFGTAAADSGSDKKNGWWFELAAGKQVNQGSDVITHTVERVVVKPTVQLDTVFFTTRIYEYTEENKKNIGTKQCPVNRSGKKSDGTSWLMAVNIKTGGKAATVTFAGDEDKGKAGINLGKLASRGVISSVGSGSELPPALSKTSNEVFDGELIDLTNPPGDAKKCLPSNDFFIMLALADKDNPLHNQKITVPVCPNPGLLIRLNMREISQ